MRPVLAAAGLLILALAAWLLFSTTQQSALPAEHAIGDTSVPPAPELGSWRGAEAVVPPAGSIERIEAAPPTADTAASFLLRVLEADGERPIPFAEVLYVADASVLSPEAEAMLEELLDVDALIEALAVLYHAGADGTVRLPLPQEDAWLVARKDNWFGMCEVPNPPPAALDVSCQLSASVTARVVNSAGIPQAGVRVNLCVGDVSLEPVIGVLAGPDGLAHIRRLEVLIAEESESADFVLALEGLLGAAAVVGFDARAPPAEPIELRMPEHGSVEVRILQKDGQALAKAAFAELSLLQDDDFGSYTPVQEFRVKVRDGVARFAPVAVGQQVCARAWLPDESLIGVAIGPGPGTAGATAILDLREDVGEPFLTGRLIGVDGEPLTNAHLGWHWSGDTGVFDPFGSDRLSIRESSLRTNAEGRFRLELEASAIESGKQESLTLVQKLENQSGASVSVILVGPLPLGEIPLGDLRLSQATLLAAGTVMDESGAALAGIPLIARLQDKNGKADLFGSIEYGEVISAADGSFELRGTAGSERLLLCAENHEYWCEYVPITQGQSGIRLVLHRFGSLRGRVVAEPSANLSGIRVALRAVEPPDPHGGSSITNLDGDLDFHFQPVRPGLYELVVTRGSGAIPLRVIENLLVVADEACADPRLKPLDLTGMLESFSIRAVASDGLPIKEFHVIARRDEEYFSNGGSGEEGVLVPRSPSPQDLFVGARGYLTVRLQAVMSDQIVTLQPGPHVRVVIDNQNLPPANCALIIKIMPVAQAEVEYWAGTLAYAEPNGTAEFVGLPSIGLFRVQVLHSVREAPGLDRTLGSLPIEESIEVNAITGIQTFSLTLTEEVLTIIRDNLREN